MSAPFVPTGHSSDDLKYIRPPSDLGLPKQPKTSEERMEQSRRVFNGWLARTYGNSPLAVSALYPGTLEPILSEAIAAGWCVHRIGDKFITVFPS